MANGDDTLDPEDVTEAEARAIFGEGQPEDRPEYMQERTVDEIPDRSPPEGPEDTLDPEDVTDEEAEAIFDPDQDEVTFEERLPEDVRQGRRQPTDAELERARRHHGAAEFGVPAEDVVVENDGTVRVSEAGQFRRAARELDVDPGTLERQGGEIRLREDVARRRVAESADYAEPEDVVIDREAGQATVSEAARERHAREQIAADLPGVEPDEVVLEDYDSPVDPDLRPLPERALPERVADLTAEGADDLADQQAAQAEREIAAERGIDPERVTVDPETGEVDVAAEHGYQRGLNRLSEGFQGVVDSVAGTIESTGDVSVPGGQTVSRLADRASVDPDDLGPAPAVVSAAGTAAQAATGTGGTPVPEIVTRAAGADDQTATTVGSIAQPASGDLGQAGPLDQFAMASGNQTLGESIDAPFAASTLRGAGTVADPFAAALAADDVARFTAGRLASGQRIRTEAAADYREAPGPLEDLGANLAAQADYTGDVARSFAPIRSREEAETAAAVGAAALATGGQSAYSTLLRPDGLERLAGGAVGAGIGSVGLGAGAVRAGRLGRTALQRYSHMGDGMTMYTGLTGRTAREGAEETTDAADDLAPLDQLSTGTGRRLPEEAPRTRQRIFGGERVDIQLPETGPRRGPPRAAGVERIMGERRAAMAADEGLPAPQNPLEQIGTAQRTRQAVLEAEAPADPLATWRPGANSLAGLAAESTERIDRAQRSEVLASGEDPTASPGSGLAPLADRATGGDGPQQLLERVQDRADRQLFDIGEQTDTTQRSQPATDVADHLDRLSGPRGRERQSAQSRQSIGERLAALSRGATDQATRQGSRQTPTAVTTTTTTPTPGTPGTPPWRIPWPRPDIADDPEQPDEDDRSLEDLFSHYWSRPVAGAGDVLGDLGDLPWLR